MWHWLNYGLLQQIILIIAARIEIELWWSYNCRLFEHHLLKQYYKRLISVLTCMKYNDGLNFVCIFNQTNCSYLIMTFMVSQVFSSVSKVTFCPIFDKTFFSCRLTRMRTGEPWQLFNINGHIHIMIGSTWNPPLIHDLLLTRYSVIGNNNDPWLMVTRTIII